MKKKLFVLLLAAAVLLTVSFPVCAENADSIETIVTIVPAPDQTKAERPPCFPDPADQYIPLPDTENFALNKPVISGAHADVYVSRNVNDGKTDTYWESKGWPAEMSIENISMICALVSPGHYCA